MQIINKKAKKNKRTKNYFFEDSQQLWMNIKVFFIAMKYCFLEFYENCKIFKFAFLSFCLTHKLLDCIQLSGLTFTIEMYMHTSLKCENIFFS